MERKPVTSSNIVSVGHDPATDTLHVEFGSGSVYAYEGVDADTHQALISADSIGGHFHRHIRGQFTGTRVD